MLRLRSLTGAAEAGHLRERPALLRRRAADLLGQHGGADAAAPGRVQAVLDGDVVVDDDLLDGDALVAREVGGHLEVHDVAGVVLDDVQDAGAAVDGLRRRQHLVRRRRGEHLARAGGVEHARADEAAVHAARAPSRRRRRSPPCPATGASARTIQCGSVWTTQAAGVRQGDAGELLPDDVLRPVDELLHRCPLQLRPPGRAGGFTVTRPSFVARRARRQGRLSPVAPSSRGRRPVLSPRASGIDSAVPPPVERRHRPDWRCRPCPAPRSPTDWSPPRCRQAGREARQPLRRDRRRLRRLRGRVGARRGAGPQGELAQRRPAQGGHDVGRARQGHRARRPGLPAEGLRRVRRATRRRSTEAAGHRRAQARRRPRTRRRLRARVTCSPSCSGTRARPAMGRVSSGAGYVACRAETVARRRRDRPPGTLDP